MKLRGYPIGEVGQYAGGSTLPFYPAAVAPAIEGGSFVGNTVVFVNEDGSSIGPISIPSGVAVFVDNGDSTWSVG